jgi:ribosome-associated translation inhibitor RaiA
MSKLNEQHQVHINCTYNQKKLASSAEHVNLYKALSKGVDAMRTQVIRKSERARAA